MANTSYNAYVTTGPDILCPFQMKGVLQAVHHAKLDPVTLSIHLARHNMIG